jgi:hypothetical protein
VGAEVELAEGTVIACHSDTQAFLNAVLRGGAFSYLHTWRGIIGTVCL